MHSFPKSGHIEEIKEENENGNDKQKCMSELKRGKQINRYRKTYTHHGF